MPPRITRVREILDAATDAVTPGDPGHGRFWRLSRADLVVVEPYGIRAVVPFDPPASGLVKALKGLPPFDGDSFGRMPLGGDPVAEADIAFIEAWIADGCPDDESTPERLFRIHPAIGVARVGDSVDGSYLGPELVGATADLSDAQQSTPSNGRYKDDKTPKGVKRQVARFRVYEYERDASGVWVATREVTSADVDLKWSVHLANRKAAGPKIFESGRRNDLVSDRDTLIINGDPTSGPVSVGAGIAGPVPISGKFLDTPVALGEIDVDSAGRLLVFGGSGEAASPTHAPADKTFNNDGWYDTTSDGWVRAAVTLRDGTVVDADPAWVLVGPPDFAPEIENLITLWDVVTDASNRIFGDPVDPRIIAKSISFPAHVEPILRRVARYRWVTSGVSGAHGDGDSMDFLSPALLAKLSSNAAGNKQVREDVFNRLRPPEGFATNDQNMPPFGGSPSLTKLQYGAMAVWKNGEFEETYPNDDAKWTDPGRFTKFDDVPVSLQPTMLDRAALQPCVGAAFYPGIEAPERIAGLLDLFPGATTPTFRHPLRISTTLPAGAISEELALPWQTDFLACGFLWWPAARPNDVLRRPDGGGDPRQERWALDVDDGDAMVALWARLGFVVPEDDGAGGTRYIEQDREI